MRRLALAGLLWAGQVHGQETAEDAQMGRRVQALLRANQASVYRCVGDQPSPSEGEVLLRVVIAHGGQALKAEILKADPGARAAADCVAQAARGWDYAALNAGDGDQVVFPLHFRPDVPGSGNLALGARITRHVLGKKGSVTLHPSHIAAVYALGPVSVSRESAALAAGELLLFPAGAVTISANARARFLFVEATGADAWTGGAAAIRSNGQRKVPILNGAGEVALYLDDVKAPFSVQRMCVKKGGSASKHEHTSDELLYIESGKGTTTLGAETVVVKGDELVTIPRGTSHSLRVDEELCAVQVYAPAGPEQRFKQPPGVKDP